MIRCRARNAAHLKSHCWEEAWSGTPSPGVPATFSRARQPPTRREPPNILVMTCSCFWCAQGSTTQLLQPVFVLSHHSVALFTRHSHGSVDSLHLASPFGIPGFFVFLLVIARRYFWVDKSMRASISHNKDEVVRVNNTRATTF